MLAQCWGYRRRMVHSVSTRSLMTTVPRMRMRLLEYEVNTLHQRGRRLYDRYNSYEFAHYRFVQHPSMALSAFFLRTGYLASSCRSVHLGMWSSSGVLNCRSVCWSLDLISSMKMSTPSLYLQTTTHPLTLPLSLRSRITNYGHRIALWWEKSHSFITYKYSVLVFETQSAA